MVPCLVCGSEERIDYVYPPYMTCVMCQHTYQPDLPPKVWMNPGDGNSNGYSGAVMNDQEKAVNTYIANWLFNRYKPKRTLDIGSGYPYLASQFAANGSEAHAIDGGFYEDLINVDGIHDVKTAAADWEVDDLPWEEKFDLITMIHVFEHMYRPHEAAKKAFDLLKPDGVLYVRLPNKDISGIERDHTPGHVKIHPSIYGTGSLLKVMQQSGFHCIWMEHQQGFGQTSCVFRKRPHFISLFMITKNEEGNIGPCLDSVRPFCDEMIVLDTGSTDRTVLEAIQHGAEVHHSKKFNKDTTYEEFHFADARNEVMALCNPQADWLFWMDADDTFEGRIVVSPMHDAYNTTVVYGNELLKHVRLFRNGWVPGFQGAIHETPDISKCRMSPASECKVHHKTGVKPGRIERNTTILEAEHKRNPYNTRTVFYLANSYKDASRYQEAISKYIQYIELNSGFHDEIVIAHFYLANSYYCLGNYQEAIRWSFKGLCVDDRHAEFYCRIGESYMTINEYKKAIPYFELALGLPGPPPTTLWTHEIFYKQVPVHQLQVCRAKLEQPAVVNDPLSKRQIIELVRPGALGDIIATTPSVSWFRDRFPGAWIRYVCHPSGFELLQRNPDIDELAEDVGECAIRKYFEYPMSEGYPETPMSKHLVEHFADSAGIKLDEDWRCKLPLPGYDHGFELPELYITFAVKTGWSKYKDWPLYRWETLITRMKKLHPNIGWVQIGGPNEEDIKAADHNLNGMTTLTQGFQVLAGSMMFVGLDSVFNHACNALQVPAVIMFGSTHPQGSGYPEATNLAANLECQPCLTGDALIQTKSGLKLMREVNTKDEVLTSDGYYHQVMDSWCSGKRDIVQLTMTNGLKVKCTPDHKILAILNRPYHKREKKITKIPACELTSEDWIVNQAGIMKELDEADNDLPDGLVISQWSNDLGYVMGYVMGDGSYSRWKDIKCLSVKAWNDDDMICLERCRVFLNNTFETRNSIYHRIKCQVPPGGTVAKSYDEWTCTWRRRPLTKLFDTLGFSKNVPLRCPKSLFSAPLNAVSGFLSGLFDADGSINISNRLDKRNRTKYNFCKINLSSAYLELLEDVQILMLRFGIHSSICKSTRTLPDKTKSSYYRLDISSSVSQQLFKEHVDFCHTSKYDRLSKMLDKSRYRYPITRLKEIKSLGQDYVYDISVNNQHDFIANGISVSNCYKENNEISVHPKPPCPFDHKCMNQFMTVNKVSEAVQAKLKNILNVEV